MHLRVALTILGLAAVPELPAQVAEPSPPPPVVSAEGAADAPVRSAEDLDQLLAPIALYPDALIALILPASTAPSDVVLAARRLAAGGQPAAFEDETWEDSVKGLAHYPEVLKWLDENLAWTRQVGEAFASQPADVMNTIQRLRARARAAGTLQDTAEQQVLVEADQIRIVPARTDVIYVPRYDPAVVYIERPVYYSRPFLTFGIGYSVGHWLAYDCDWHRRTVWVVPKPHRHRHWHSWPDWRHARHRQWDHRSHDHWQAWHPRPHHPRRAYGGHDRHDPRGPAFSPGHPPRPDITRRPPHDRGGRDGWRRDFRPPVAGDDRPRPGYRPDRGDGRRDRPRRDYRPDRLPGGTTPDRAAPVGPVVDVRPRIEPPRSAPALTPTGRRMPGRESHAEREPRTLVRTPTGRLMPSSAGAAVAPARTAPSVSRAERRPDAAPRMSPPRSDFGSRSSGGDGGGGRRSGDGGATRNPTGRPGGTRGSDQRD